jgi:septal ring factor EnvC (AmiA/AmiB activator)
MASLEGNMRVQRDELMEMVKRNYDVVVEKFELQRQRNEGLEKTAVEKEKLYNEIKSENDQLANLNYKLQRTNEDLQNEKRINETKVRNNEGLLRQSQEETRVFKLSADKLDCQLKVSLEQLDSLKKSLDDVSTKKQQELDLLSKELGSLTLKEREAKQRAYLMEAQLSESRDEQRQLQTEVDSRSRENEHLVSLLEDQEQKLALYEQKERAVQQLAAESKRRIEEAQSDRDKVMLKEGQYLREIARLEERIKVE